MISVVMDTSSLVSLEMIEILKKCLKIIKITIPTSVEEELKELSEYKDREGKASEEILRLIKSKQINVIKVENRKKVESLLSADVDKGEAECLVCCLEKKINTLIMDDVDAAYRLEGIAIANNIKMKISVAVIIELLRQGKISKRKAIATVNKLIKLRKWEGGILEILSKKYLESKLI
jgi:predicted nucleic acid-binding protein